MSNIKINDVPQRIQYSATGGQTQFTIPFPFFANSYVYVWLNGIQLLQGGAPGQYVVTGAGSPSGGLVTFNTAATLNDIVTIEGIMPIDRTSIYSATISNLTGSDLNGDFNREVVMLQQLNTTQSFMQLQYAPWAEVSQDLTVTKDRYIPLLSPNQVWAMNDAGTEIVAYDVPSGGGIAPNNAEYLVRVANTEVPNAQVMGSLANGFVVNTTTTGVQLTREFEGTLNQLGVNNPSGISGNPVYYIADNAVLPGTGGMGIPSGTTAQRVIPTPPSIGLRFNTSLSIIEAYIGGSWVEIPSSSAGLFLPLSGGTMSGNIDMDGNEINNAVFGTDTDADSHKIINLATPTADDDAANKAYVDLIAAGFFFIEPVRVASTANFVATYNNGTAGVGATLTANSNGAASIDSVSLVLNDRALFKDQTSTLENGIYFVSQVGDGSTPAIYTRALDYDEPSDIDPGDMVTVLQGTANASTFWVETAVVTTIGTDSITFAQFGLSSGNFVTLSGTQTITGDKTFSGITTLDNFIFDANQMQHVADTNNYFEFGADTQNFVTGGSSRMDLSDTGLRLGGANSRVTTILNEDNMASDSDTALATQQSIKAYVDTSLDGALTPTSIQFTTTTEIIGTTTNNNAAAGSVGEEISSVVSSGVTLNNAIATNITSIVLTSGDWDVFAEVWINPVNVTTLTTCSGSISTVSATDPVLPATSSSYTQIRGISALTAQLLLLPIKQARITVANATTTTVYLVASASYTGTTSSGIGVIQARRRR